MNISSAYDLRNLTEIDGHYPESLIIINGAVIGLFIIISMKYTKETKPVWTD